MDMDEAREAILRQLHHGRQPPADAAQHYIQVPVRGPLPTLKTGAQAQFSAKLTASGASIERASDNAQLVQSVTDFLRRHHQALKLCVMPHPLLAGLSWPEELQTETRGVEATDLSVLTVGCYGIAETGSVVMLSSHDTPAEANFLPDNFICVVRGKDIVAHVEEVWEHLRQTTNMPAVVNLISGPSRTADVEQTIQLGAHGPRRMHVIMLD